VVPNPFTYWREKRDEVVRQREEQLAQERKEHPERFYPDGTRRPFREHYRQAVVAGEVERASAAAERGETTFTVVLRALDQGAAGDLIEGLAQVGWELSATVPGGIRTSLVFRRSSPGEDQAAPAAP
jgi:hypothetical protein